MAGLNTIFGGQPKVEPTKVTAMPDPLAIERAEEARMRRRSLTRRGRASTRLTPRGEAGTTAYGNSLLGQAG